MPPSQPPAAVAAPARKRLVPRMLAASLVLVLAGIPLSTYLPKYMAGLMAGSMPDVLQLAVTGAALILLTAVVLAYAAKTIGLGWGWFALAFGYNALLILIKFVTVPSALYGQTYVVGFLSFDPNDTFSYILSASFIFLLYALVLWGIYAVYRSKLRAVLAEVGLPPRKLSLWRTVLITVLFLVIVALLIQPAALVLFGAGYSFEYLSHVLSGKEWTLVALEVQVLAALVLAIGAFDRATVRATELRDGAVLAATFWLGLSLIAAYHILWIVYMGVLLSLWPFVTVRPSESD